MVLLASKLVMPSIEKTKSLLWPFHFITWLRLAVLVIFIGNIGLGSNYNIPSLDSQKLNIADFFAQYWMILLVMAILIIIIGIIYSFLRAVFHFCFFDSITTKNVQILSYFQKNLRKGKSLFLLDFVINAAILLLSIALFYPTIKTFIINISNLSWGLFSIKRIIISVVFLVVMTMITRVLIWVFTIYYMYEADEDAWKSLRRVIPLCLRKWKETIVFLLINLGLGIAAGIGIVIAVLILTLALALIGAVLFGIGFLLYKLTAVLLIPLIVIGVILAVLWGIALITGFLMIMVPVTTFFGYYRLSFMKNLLKKT